MWFFILSLLASVLLGAWQAEGKSTPAPAHYFEHQKVDHYSTSELKYTQRYYKLEKEFKGPGYPIFLILGGEGGIPPTTGLFYPFITDVLAPAFGAYVLQPEHRFYGESQPLQNTTHDLISETDPRVNLFTSEQALHDAIRLLEYTQKEIGCELNDRSSPDYCPVITVGGSYPGFLSAMARIMFPSKVDMAYAASAPIFFYAQEVPQYAYYDHITLVAEETISGCAKAVKYTLEDVVNKIHEIDTSCYHQTVKGLEDFLGICQGTIPPYTLASLNTTSDLSTFVDEVMMVVGYSFANDNMANYPPNAKAPTRLYKACELFMSPTKTSKEKIEEFLVARVGEKRTETKEQLPTKRLATPLNHQDFPCGKCWNMTAQLPTGRNATISGGDWSGDGTGADAESWDFQTCTLLVEAIGFGPDSMFPPRDWSLDWLQQHCDSRFGVRPRPAQLVNQYKFNRLEKTNVSHILFTNGENDGWSVSGIRSNLSDSLLVINFPNGAHHSELGSPVSPDYDTADITQGFETIQIILSSWLGEIYNQRQSLGTVKSV